MGLKIGSYETILKPINPVPLKFDKSGKKEKYVNLKGEELEKMEISRSEYKWVNKVTGLEHDHKKEAPSKCFEGQPVGTQDKTTAVEPEECEKELFFSYAKVSNSYQVICKELKEELKTSGKAKTFQYPSGRNYLPERAIVYYDVAKDIVIMRTMAGDFSKIDFTEEMNEKPVEVKEKAKPITIQV